MLFQWSTNALYEKNLNLINILLFTFVYALSGNIKHFIVSFMSISYTYQLLFVHESISEYIMWIGISNVKKIRIFDYVENSDAKSFDFLALFAYSIKFDWQKFACHEFFFVRVEKKIAPQ